MRNIKLTIEYDGTHFNGWQVQDKKKRTIQGEIQEALSQIFKKKIGILGSGRTDSGVHAIGQTANFKTTSPMTPRQILKALNAILPEDIVITKTQDVPEGFHARYSAKSKTYRYTILNRESRSPHLRNFTSFYPYRLDLRLMRQEARALIGKKDFRSFQASDPFMKRAGQSQEKTGIRTMKKIDIKKRGDLIHIDMEADGFLYKMVRNIVGTLLQVGSGRRPGGSVKKILQEKRRSAAGPTAPSEGLCLVEVKY